MKKYISFLLFTCCTLLMHAQQITVVIEGATIHTGNGKVIDNGYVVFESGRIVLVDSVMRSTYKNARVINAKGKHVYPGVIALNTITGLNEIDAVRATRDFAETGDINPNVRSIVAYNTDSKVTPTLLSNGILYMQIVPHGGLISGSSSIVKTDGFNWEDAAIRTDDAVHLNWPQQYTSAWWGEEAEEEEEMKQAEKDELTLSAFFDQAAQYALVQKPAVVNLRLETMRAVMKGQKKLFVHADDVKAIIKSVHFFKKYPEIRMVLVGAGDAYLVKDLLAAEKIPVVLELTHNLPQRNHEDIDQPFKTPAQLMQAGIMVAIGHHGSWEPRNVMFNAGTAAAYGLSKEQALMLVTKNAAEIAGIGNNVGTIETGKQASLLICEGDLLNMKESVVTQAFIDGEEVDLDNRQKELYRKYSERYGQKAE